MTTDEIKKKYPNLDSFWPYLDQLNLESPRGVVLISAGFLEEQLKKVLLEFFIDAPQARKLVDGGFAPLGTFSSRISACYSLGLITDKEYSDLELIRNIRNDFAHELDTSFVSQSLIDRCKELNHKAEDPVKQKMEAQAQFTSAAVSLILNLANRPHYVSKEKRTSKEWPYDDKSPKTRD